MPAPAPAPAATTAASVSPTTGKTSGASGLEDMVLPYMIIPLTILYLAPFVLHFINSQKKKVKWIKLWKLGRFVPIPN